MMRILYVVAGLALLGAAGDGGRARLARHAPDRPCRTFHGPFATIPVPTDRSTTVHPATLEASDVPENLLANFVAALLFATLGIVVLLVSFVTLDRLTPYTLWKEIVDEHNTALAILIGAIALGISIIIAAAIH